MNDEIEISISDPTMQNKGKINIVLNEKLSSVIEGNDKVKVEEKDGKTNLIVDVSKSFGGSIKVKLKVESKIDSWKALVDYKIKDTVLFNGKTYECIQAHKSIDTWEPNVAHSLWKEKKDEN